MSEKKYSVFHVFGWGDSSSDRFFDSYDDAMSYYIKLGEDGYSERRLYEEIFDSKEDYDYGMCTEEILLASDPVFTGE